MGKSETEKEKKKMFTNECSIGLPSKLHDVHLKLNLR